MDELEARRQRRRDTRAGLISWVKSLRGNFPTDKRSALAAGVATGDLDLRGAVERVLGACTDEDIVDMLALCAGAHQYGELAEHIRAVWFVETEAERVAREASPPRMAYAKLNDSASAWLWGALSRVRDRAPREGHPDVVAVMDALLTSLRPAKTP